MSPRNYGSAMFNCGMLFTLIQGVREPLRSALLEQLFRVMADLDKDMEEKEKGED